MAKWFGEIGFAVAAEIDSGVWIDEITPKSYYGDFSRISYRYQRGDKINDDMNISNQLSIVADSFAQENLGAMRYVTYGGTKWKIMNVEVQYPRLILTLGGVYNG